MALKHPELPESKLTPHSEEIIEKGIEQPGTVYRMALDLFVGLYSDFLGDTLLRTLCYGGLYLVGGLSFSIAEYLKDPKTAFLEEYMKRRPYMKDIFKDMPIVVSK